MKKTTLHAGMASILSILAVAAGATEIIGPAGVNTAVPRGTLELNETTLNPNLLISKNHAPKEYFQIQEFGGGVAQMQKVGQNTVQIEFNPSPLDGTSGAFFKFFRATNTTGGKFVDFQRGNGTNTTDVRIGVDGFASFFTNTRVGIGTNAPSAAYVLDVVGSSRLQTASVTNALTAGSVVAAGAVSGASIAATGAVSGATVASTGAMTSGGDLTANGEITCDVINILGGADLSEGFNVKAGAREALPGMLVCIDPANAGDLVVSSRAYDRTVAGVLSGANGVKPGMVMQQSAVKVASGPHPVALSGRVYCLADATGGAIVPGDLLTTSDTPGHAMKAAQPERAPGAVIGKAMTGLNEGKGMVLVLVSLQ